MTKVYLDHAATTPLHPDVTAKFTELLGSLFGNPSSIHSYGREARKWLDGARKIMAQSINAKPGEIIFTSGGTEADNIAVYGTAAAMKTKGNHIITSLGEHPSIDSALEYLKNDGFVITKIPFTADGFINLDLFEKAITSKTIVASIQHINPEIGTIQPITEISSIVKKHGILLHSDCVQSFGKVDLKPIAQLVDSLTISAHKVHGPKGVGVTYIHPRNRLIPVFPGLVHESGFRGGTVNVPGIAAFITAIKETAKYNESAKKFTLYRNAFLTKLTEFPESFTVHESPEKGKQLPQIIGLRVHNIEGQLMMLELNRYGFAISTGSACQIGQQTSSKAMLALTIQPQQAREFIRISFGKSTTLESVKALVNQLIFIKQQMNEKQQVMHSL